MNYYSFNTTANTSSTNNSNQANSSTSNRANTGTVGSRSTNAAVAGTAAASAVAPAIGMWGENDGLENDDFDSDQLDEDESYSWASGITDHQDAFNSNGISSSYANINWRDWKTCNQFSSNPFSSSRASRNSAKLVSQTSSSNSGGVEKLVDLCAQFIASNVPFELVESFRQPVPEELQLKITFASFPSLIENIRLYSCLANGTVDEYLKGELLYNNKCVKRIIQIGFHLSAQVLNNVPNNNNNNNNAINVNSNQHNHGFGSSNSSRDGPMFNIGHFTSTALNRPNTNTSNTINNSNTQQPSSNSYFNVAIVCDRRRITSCSCTCTKQSVSWCSHIVAVCLYRILEPQNVELRAPVSESLSKLHRDQLQKFAQYLISELPQQILPTAQKLLDELLKGTESSINLLSGAPDPTAGASQNDISVWCLDDLILQENIHKTLQKFIVPTPNVVSDIECLEHASSATAAEYTSLLRPLRGKEPEGMWNLISIVREMFRRHDKNSIPLLRIITHECISMEQVVQLWFLVKSSQLYYDKVLFNNVTVPSNFSGSHHRNTNNSNTNNLGQTPPVHQACASLMDEIVLLWRIACLNPILSKNLYEKQNYREQLLTWQTLIFDSIKKYFEMILKNTRSSPNSNILLAGVMNSNNGSINNGEKMLKRLDIDLFSGFLPAILACQLTWNEYDFDNLTDFQNRFIKVLPKSLFSKIISKSNKKLSEDDSNLNRTEKSLKKLNIKSESDPLITEKSNEISQQPTTSQQAGENASSEKEVDECMNLYSFEYDPSKIKSNDQANQPNSSNKINTVLEDLMKLKSKYFDLSDLPSDSPLFTNEYSLETLFARCEALYEHGYNQHACLLAKILADYMLYMANKAKTNYELASLSNIPGLIVQSNKSEQASVVAVASSSSTLNQQQQQANRLIQLKSKCVTNFHNTVLCRAYTLANILYETSIQLPSTFEKDHLSFNCNLDYLNSIFKLDPEENENEFGQVKFYPKSLSQLAFRVGIFGLETLRMPALSKALEVKLINQEQELSTLLKRIPIGKYELNLLRDRAMKLKDLDNLTQYQQKFSNPSINNVSYSLPITLASYIFDLLNNSNSRVNLDPLDPVESFDSLVDQPTIITMDDQQLAFEAAVNVLGLKAYVSESQHPLLCEGIRRQKGDLALTLLLTYKDDQSRLLRIIDKILDKDIHALFKDGSTVIQNPFNPVFKKIQQQQLNEFMQLDQANNTISSINNNNNTQQPNQIAAKSTLHANVQQLPTIQKPPIQSVQSQAANQPQVDTHASQLTKSPSSKQLSFKISPLPQTQTSKSLFLASKSAMDSLSSGWEESENESPNLNSNALLEAKYRCLSQKQQSVLTSQLNKAADVTTTSSDNSPTVSRKSNTLTSTTASNFDSQSSKKCAAGDDSDDSVESSSSHCEDKLSSKKEFPPNQSVTQPKPEEVKAKEPECSQQDQVEQEKPPTTNDMLIKQQLTAQSNSVVTSKQPVNIKRTKANPPLTTQSSSSSGSNSSLNTAAGGAVSSAQVTSGNGRPINQPSEALAHFMFEFSRTVLSKAGGTVSTSVFLNHQAHQPNNGPHRNLHICSFLISLYALGLHNCLQPSWLSRTYSSHVTWINSQAVDIGFAAICILIECWQGRLTPSECVSLADRVSRGRDNMAVKAAAELALSSLSFANLMNLSEIQRALIQCKEQSNDMLQRACITVENAVKDGTSSILLEILFSLARRWEELFNESTRTFNINNPNSAAMNQNIASPMATACTPVDLVYFNQNQLHMNANIMLNKGLPISNFPFDPRNYIQQPNQMTPHQPFTASIATTIPPNATLNNFQAQHFGAAGVNVNVNVNMGINGPAPNNFNSIVNNLPVTLLSTNLPCGNSQPQGFMASPNMYGPTQQASPNPTTFNNAFNQQFNLNMSHQNFNPNFNNFQQYQYQTFFKQQQQQQQLFNSNNNNAAAAAATNLETIDPTSLKYLTSAFRVGLLGLEAVPKKPENTNIAKNRQSPMYADDVKWLLSIAIKLDSYTKSSSHLQQFCQIAGNAIQNPLLLQELAIESANYLCRNNPQLFSNAISSPILSVLLEKCMNAYQRCLTTKIILVGANEFDDFINIVRTSRSVFYFTNQMPRFKDMLESIRKARGCKKDLAKMINNLKNEPIRFN